MAPSDFLDSVVECLDLDNPDKLPSTEVEKKPLEDHFPVITRSEESISERLDRLHKDLDSIASILIDEQGVPAENIWETIEDFGIKRDDLKKIDPSYKELFEIYSAIRAYRVSVRYLKELKTKFSGA